MGSFDSVAAFYEVLSDSAARLEREGPLLAELSRRAPGKRVCDIACGTGLHAAYLAGLGAEVLAVDASPEMVRHAQARRPHKNIRYAAADMRDLPEFQADLVLCLGNSINLLGNVEEARAVVADVAERLAPGGLFCVQVLNNEAEGMDKPRHRVQRKETEDGVVVAIKNLVPQGDRTLLTLNFFHESDGAWEQASDAAVLLHLALDDLKGAAEDAGLALSDVYGAYDERPYEASTSPDLIVVLMRE